MASYVAAGRDGVAMAARVALAALLLPLLLPLAGCVGLPGAGGAPGDAAAADPLAACCVDVERWPPLLVAAADPAAPLVGRTIGSVVWRPGALAGEPGARAALLGHLKPLDIVLNSHRGRLSNHALPGLFAHAAAYLGTEAELRAAGVWDDPRVVPHHAAIRAGRSFIEADKDGVHLSAAEGILDADRVAVVRPCLARPERRRTALTAYFAAVGGPFDFNFDARTADRVFCAELVHRVLADVDVPERPAYGRTVVVPDEFAKAAATAGSGVSFVLYLRGGPGGWEQVPRAGLVADLAAAWAPPSRRAGDPLRP